jgi:hypothetical protein
MKIPICLSLLLLLFFPASRLRAQIAGNERSFAGNFKTNVLAPFALSYEGPVSEKRSLLLEFRYSPTADFFDKGHRVVIASEMRFYIDKYRSGLSGFYVGPYVKYRHMTIDKQEDIFTTALTFGLLGMIEKELKLHTFGLGGHVGYQWILSRGIVLNAFGSLGYNPIVRKRGFTVLDKNYNIDIRLGFSVGIAIPSFK